jgi:teichoic acid transport system permease protein
MITLPRAELKAENFNTVLGQAWRVLDPLLLAGVYYVLIGILRGGERASAVRLALLVASMFLFYFTKNAWQYGSKSIVSNRLLVLNTPFPRAVLPLASVLRASMELWPALAVYAVIHVLAGLPITSALLYLPMLLLIQAAFNVGGALGLAAWTVYARDVPNVLNYVTRLWLYVTPVLWVLSDVPEGLQGFLVMNPLYPLFASYHSILNGDIPSSVHVFAALCWASLSLVAGSWFFLSRERSFAAQL